MIKQITSDGKVLESAEPTPAKTRQGFDALSQTLVVQAAGEQRLYVRVVGANVLAACSALAAAWVARRVGLLNAMVFTHLPSNVLLLLVPLMPSLGLAVTVLLLRFSISQMDVPTRQSYTVAVVSPDERSAASGVTGVARSLGSAVSPLLATALIGVPSLAGVPFVLAGGVKIVYDLLLYRSFVAQRPPEEA